MLLRPAVVNDEYYYVGLLIFHVLRWGFLHRTIVFHGVSQERNNVLIWSNNREEKSTDVS